MEDRVSERGWERVRVRHMDRRLTKFESEERSCTLECNCERKRIRENYWPLSNLRGI